MKVICNDNSIDIYEGADAQQVLRHTAAHILAQAVKRLYPHAAFGFGPATEKGFYYDMDLGDVKLSEQDLGLIEEEMSRIVKENFPVHPFAVSSKEAVKLMQERNEPYKVEHIADLAENEPISFYRHGEYIDMCRGPHLTYTKGLKAFKLTSVSGAYWRNDSSNKMLTRISGVAFETQTELDAYMRLQEEAVKRDHRKIGREMKLFLLREEAIGFPFFLPNGLILKNTLIEYWRELHRANGYVEISTPLIMNRKLWETSGHWDHYKNTMYSTVIDDQINCVKPMNCPGGVLVYASEPHSYRELPIRAGELGVVHRNELRGTLHGLMRVRSFTQDDAHIFMRTDQITDEIMGVVHLINEVYTKFGFKYFIELSTRPVDSMGSDEDWEAATSGLKNALEKLGLEYTINEGDGAFYGPKIDFHLQDSIGRTWQCGTIQLDFQMPINFKLEYISESGQREQPVMIHRVCFGSIERFIGILTEHYAGKFPVWLAPEQARVIPVSDKSIAHAKEVYEKLFRDGIRVSLDDRSEKVGYKIREARQVMRVPYMLIIGEKETADGTVSVRSRDTDETVIMTPDELAEKIKNEIIERI